MPPFSSVQPQPVLCHGSDSCSIGIGTDTSQLLEVQNRRHLLPGLSIEGGTPKSDTLEAYHQAFAAETNLSFVPTYEDATEALANLQAVVSSCRS